MTFRQLSTLFVRSMRHDARAVSCHVGRVIVVLVLYYLILCLIPELSAATVAAPGLSLFTGILITNALIIGGIAAPYFAGVLAEEREEQTLGLLLMSGMSAATLLLGKSGGRLLTFASILAAQVPLMLLCVTFGGVTQLQVLAAYAGLMAHLVLVAALGLLSAVVLERRNSAVRLAVVLWGTAAFGVQVLHTIWNGLQLAAYFPGWVDTFFDSAVPYSPFSRFRSVCSSSFTPANRADYLLAVISPHEWLSILLAILVVLRASFRFSFYEENSRQDSETPGTRRWWSPWRRFRSSASAAHRRLHMRRPQLLPIFCKDYSLVLGGIAWPILSAFLYPAVMFVLHMRTFGGLMALSFRLTDALLYGGTLLLLLNAGRYAAELVQVELTSKAASGLTLLPSGWSRIIGEKVLVWLLGLLPASAVIAFGLFYGYASDCIWVVHEFLANLGASAPERCMVILAVVTHAALTAMFTFGNRQLAVLGSRVILLAFWVTFMVRMFDFNWFEQLTRFVGKYVSDPVYVVTSGVISVEILIILFCFWRIRAGFLAAAAQ